MPHISKLPITAKLRPSELLAAFMARSAAENLLSPKQLSDVLRESAYGTRAAPTGATEAEALSRMLFALGNPAFAEQPTTVADLNLRNWSGRSFKQVCPACLKADQTIAHGLTEKSWAVCLLHRIAHITHCPRCHARLSWGQGSYFYCACGCDLRFGPFVPASEELSGFLTAVVYDRAPVPVDASSAQPIDDIWAAKGRLKSAFAYLTGGLTTSSGTIPQEAAEPATPFLHFWEDVMKVVGAAGGLTETVRAIETRLALAGRARANRSVKEAHVRRSQITWRHLAECASAAMAAAPRVDKNTLHLSTRAGHRLSADVAAVKGLPTELSAALRSALDREIRTYLETQDACSEAVTKRIDAITDLAKDLRPLRSPNWTRPAFDDVAEIFSLIACGVLTPWGPSHLHSWHVRATDVAEIVNELQPLPCGRDELAPGVGYVLRHSAIFDARASVLEWVNLSRSDVVERVGRLLPDWLESFKPEAQWRSGPSRSRLPFGFSYFLAHPWVRRFAVDGDPTIGKCYVISSDEENVHEALVRAWETATSRVAQLQGWDRDSALASQQVLHICSPVGNPMFGAEATAATLAFKAQVGQRIFASTLGGFLGTTPVSFGAPPPGLLPEAMPSSDGG